MGEEDEKSKLAVILRVCCRASNQDVPGTSFLGKLKNG